MASFFKRLSRSKSADITDIGYHGGYVDGDLVNKRRTSNTRERSGSDSKSERKQQQEHINAVMNDHGLLRSPMKYPTFTCHYLGRMPASGEFGRENVEGPVDSLCKLRERQKLPKVVMKFDKDGMHVKEISGPFSKPKREGIHQFVPLHHVSYGVGSLIHPYVFACITRIMDDPDEPSNQVLVLHAFLCDKPETTRSITYWQLQSYIEAYEELKKKKLLRKMRKKARMRARLDELDNMSTHTTTTTLSNDSQESRKLDDEPSTETAATANKENNDTEKAQLPDVTNTAEKQDEPENVTPETKDVPAATETKTCTDKEEIEDDTQKDDKEKIENREPEEDDENEEEEEDEERDNGEAGVENGETGGAQGDDVFHQTEGRNPRDIAFERRILELQQMFDMDPDDLKQLLLRDNPTIKRVFHGSIDAEGTFRVKALNLGGDKDSSHA
ncbi:uncharacterized protein LOC144449126 [Glandiceps talaboti]